MLWAFCQGIALPTQAARSQTTDHYLSVVVQPSGYCLRLDEIEQCLTQRFQLLYRGRSHTGF